MDQIVKELHEAAGEGNVASLLNLLEKDRFMLDRSMVISYGETPLHIAAMLGHLEFCKELLRRKPELAEELDLRRSSALHLASAKGFTEIVKLLVSKSPKMGFAFDDDGKIPIHVAAMKGRVGALKELVDVQPDAAHTRVEMGHGETVLHLCVQYSQLEALRFLVEHLNDEELVNVKDDNGNSILHLAVFDKQVQIINYLVQNTKIDMYAANLSGLKAVDILAQTRRDSKYIEIYDCLHNHPSQSSNGVPSSEHVVQYDNPSSRYQKLLKSKNKNKASKRMNKSQSQLNQQTMWLNKQRNSLMIVASLIATMGFQATLSPPAGFWQQDIAPDNSFGTTGNSNYAVKHLNEYKEFMIGNTIGFISSLSVILLLIGGLPYKRKVFMWILMVIMWISISAMAFTYSMAVYASILASPELQGWFSRLLRELIFGWMVIMAFLNLMHTIRLISHGIRRWGSKLRVFMWTMVVILWIALCVFNKYIILYFSRIEGGSICVAVLIVVAMGWFVLLVIFGVAIPVWFIIKIIMKLISFFRKIIKEVIMKSSRNQDSIIVV